MGRFQPDQSGNPFGLRRGCKHRITLAAAALRETATLIGGLAALVAAGAQAIASD